MNTTTRPRAVDSLALARRRLDHRFDEIAHEYAGQPQHDVLMALEREVCAAGVTPTRADLSALARQIAGQDSSG
jgi:hypothetical protein